MSSPASLPSFFAGSTKYLIRPLRVVFVVDVSGSMDETVSANVRFSCLSDELERDTEDTNKKDKADEKNESERNGEV